MHGDLSDNRKVNPVTLVDIVQPTAIGFVQLVVFSGCGLPVISKPTFKNNESDKLMFMSVKVNCKLYE